MISPQINPDYTFKSAQNNSNLEVQSPGSFAEFSQLLQEALNKEQQSDTSFDSHVSTLNLKSGTEGFDKLGVLILRALNETNEALVFGEEIADQGLDISHNIVAEDQILNIDAVINDSLDANSLSNNVNLDQLAGYSQLGSSSDTNSTISRRVRSVTTLPSVSQIVSVSSPINQVRGITYVVKTEVAQSTTAVRVGDATEAENSEIEVTVIRGELGLIVQISSPSLDPRLSKALENRLRRLVEQSGEKIERFLFITTPKLTEFPIINRGTYGSD